MKIIRSDAFKRDYQELPLPIQMLFDKKIRLFMKNIHHPSFRVKKMRGHTNRWEASINMFYRYTFEIHNEHYFFRRVGPHDVVLKNP